MAALRFKPAAFSASGFGSFLVNLTYGGVFVSKIVMGILSILTLAAADTFIGGVVLVDMVGGSNSQYSFVGWLGSVATSGLMLGLLGFAMLKKGPALLLMLPVVAIGLGDAWVDWHFPTFLIFGHEGVMNFWLVPDGVNPGWWALHIFTLISLFGEIGISFMFAWLFALIKNVRGEAASRVPASAPVPATA